MEIKIAGLKLTHVQRQRNLLLLLVILLTLVALLLSGKLMLSQERVILVPGLQQEVWTSQKEVSTSFLEETTLMYLPFLLDLEEGNIEWKRDRILMHVAKENENYVELMRQYFAKAKEDYRKFQLKTYFNPKKLIVKPQKLEVLIEGVLVSLFGDYGHEQKEAFYQMSFIWLGGKLLIKEFKSITKEAKEEMK
jgi:type IV conjugative transfer system protein TraE